MKYKFVQYSKGFGNSIPDSKVTLSVDATSLRDLLDYFEQFLRGSGFQFDGHLEVVDTKDDTDVDGRESSGEKQETSEEEQI